MCEKWAIKPHERLLFSTEWISYDQIKQENWRTLVLIVRPLMPVLDFR